MVYETGSGLHQQCIEFMAVAIWFKFPQAAPLTSQMHAEVYTNVEMKFGKFNFNIVIIVLCAFDDVEKVLTFVIRDSWYPPGAVASP